MRILIPVTLLLLLLPAAPLAAQVHNAETTASVPALQKYHTVIFSLWHTAWPKKDTAMMARLLPDLEQGAAAVAAAPLPGILRDKKPAWDAGIGKLNSALATYRSAVEAREMDRLLAAAEELHRQYEGLVRVIRPVLKELEAFHSVLYLLYHYYWPEGDLPRIRESAGALTERMAGLDSAVLPKRLAPKTESFTAARANLGRSVRSLRDLFARESDTPSAEELRSAVTSLHTSYQALEKIFD